MNLTLGNFLSSFMSCNDDFKNMKIAWELHHEIKKIQKILIPWFSTFHYARRLQKSHLWSAWILLEYYIAHCTMMRFFKTFIVEHGKANKVHSFKVLMLKAFAIIYSSTLGINLKVSNDTNFLLATFFIFHENLNF